MNTEILNDNIQALALCLSVQTEVFDSTAYSEIYCTTDGQNLQRLRKL